MVTSAFWRTVSPVLLALDWSRMLISQSDDGGLDGGCRVDIRWPESFRAIIRGLSGGLVHAFPDVHSGTDAGLESSKSLSFRAR